MNTAVVVIGAGPVGVRAVEEISALNPDVSISLYGDEPYAPYPGQAIALSGRQR